VIHPDCFVALCEKAKKEVPLNSNKEAAVVCSLKCYKVVMKSHLVINGSKIDEPERRRVNWNDDNANNSDQSSMNILINWVTTEGRYAAYRGGEGHNGRSKTETNCSAIH